MEILKIKQQENGYLINDSMFVPKDENNRHYKKVQEWLKTNEAEPQFTDTELNTQRVSNIKAKASELILSVYPIYKQNNILMNEAKTSTIYIDMKTFINNIRNISNQAEANGTQLEDIVWS